ncbi:MAG: DUF2520 domain-containing protein [Ignavibacteria bacterium]|nr:DUF2520 domain-containing protein [Ignavibacteria bacterium]
MKRRVPWNIAIVGAGKVGQTLGRILVENGNHVVAVVSRSKASAAAGAKFLQCKTVSTTLDSIPVDVKLVFIATPHAAVATVAEELAQVETLPFSRISVCHASGMLSAEALEPLRLRGAKVFSFHPLQTFPRDFEPRNIVPHARGIYYGVDGDGPSLRVARQLAARLDGKTVVIAPDHRILYHAACVIASNHLTTMMSVLDEMFRSLRTEEQDFFPVFKPIVMATLSNVEKTSPARALSGPVARGGVETVAGHLEAVRSMTPSLLPYFLSLSRETVRLAVEKGSLTPFQERNMLDLLQSYTKQ